MKLPLAIAALIGLTAHAGAQAQSYSAEALDQLRYMIEEEKLAGDVYRAFGTLYPSIMPFRNIPKSEDTHVATLVAQANLANVDIGDLTSPPAGTFHDARLQALYGQLIGEGQGSSFAALTVGKNIELLDIDDLNRARALVPTDSSLYAAYGQLLNASNNHLRAFNNWLAMTPAPVAAVPEPQGDAMLLAGLGLLALLGRRTMAPRPADSSQPA